MRKTLAVLTAAVLVMGFTAVAQAQGNGGNTQGNIRSQGGTGNGVSDTGKTTSAGMGAKHSSHKSKKHRSHS